MNSEVNTNELIFDIKKNKMKPYDIGQMLLIKDGMALGSKLKQSKFLDGMVFNLKSQQVGYTTFSDDALNASYLRINIITYNQVSYKIAAFLIVISCLYFQPFDSIYTLGMLGWFGKVGGKVTSSTTRITPKSGVQGYAYNRIHTPDPTTCSNEALNNNEPVVFPRKNKASPVVQHPEHVVDQCTKADCETKVCDKPCEQVVSSTSVAHYTHSNKKATNPEPFSETDFDQRPKPIYRKEYANPHETSGESINPIKDEKNTEVLQQMIKRKNDDK